MLIIILATSILVSGIIGLYLSSNNENAISFSLMLTVIGLLLLVAGCFETTPTALDVYRGKTTLEITYKDGVAVDTVVVFKD